MNNYAKKNKHHARKCFRRILTNTWWNCYYHQVREDRYSNKSMFDLFFLDRDRFHLPDDRSTNTSVHHMMDWKIIVENIQFVARRIWFDRTVLLQEEKIPHRFEVNEEAKSSSSYRFLLDRFSLLYINKVFAEDLTEINNTYMVVENHFPDAHSQHWLNRSSDTSHNHRLYMSDWNKHIDHSNICHDYDMMNHKDSILDESDWSKINGNWWANILPGVIQSGRWAGVDMQIRSLGHNESEQTCLTTKDTL